MEGQAVNTKKQIDYLTIKGFKSIKNLDRFRLNPGVHFNTKSIRQCRLSIVSPFTHLANCIVN